MTPRSNSPLLLIISGLPASGKTHLGEFLAASLSWPLVTKDDYKIIACDYLPSLSNAEAGPLSFALMWQVAEVILRAGHDTLLETHFYRSLYPSEPPSLSEQHILGLAQRHKARLVQIFCHAPITELEHRHAARVASGARPRIDFSFKHTALPAHCCWEPLNLGATPLLRLDTTQPGSNERALAWIKAELSRQP